MTHPLAMVTWPVRTERLLLRRATADDVDATWRYRRLPEVNEWLGGGTGDYASYRERFLEPDRLSAKVVVMLGATVIGDVVVRVEDAWAQEEVAEQARGVQAELGWNLDPAYGRRGYATEAVRAVVDLCFGPLGLRRIHADCFAANEPSWRLMERLGMRREMHTVKESLHRTRGWLDGLCYALLAEEWPGAEGRRRAGGGRGRSPRRVELSVAGVRMVG